MFEQSTRISGGCTLELTHFRKTGLTMLTICLVGQAQNKTRFRAA
jgi:hypothetical protein